MCERISRSLPRTEQRDSIWSSFSTEKMEDFDNINEAYRPLASLNLVFTLLWFLSAACWFINTYNNRHFQANKLQWTLAAVPLIKALQMTLSFTFWYSCFYLKLCSLWMSFGVFVIGALFQTVIFVSFLLISLGYCITCEHLSIAERRATTALGCIFYLTLVGYRASIPYFSVLLLVNYFVTFYMIFRHVSQNLLLLREQLSIIEDEDVHAMHDAIFTKYIMFKKFQGAMHVVAMAEFAIFINMDSSLENYWLRLVIREWAHLCILIYIGWIFRSKDLAPRFSVMPALKNREKTTVPPIYRIEMDAATFKDFRSHEWHIGVPTSLGKGRCEDPVLVVIQHPNAHKNRMNSGAIRTAAISTSPNVVNSSHPFFEKQQYFRTN